MTSLPPKLHLDADASRKSLQRALLEHGHDVTRTPCAWMPLDASDEEQLHRATAQGRVIFTFNIADFVHLARTVPAHGGIVVAHQAAWSIQALIAALDLLLSTTSAGEWPGQLRWLNDWRR